MTIPKNQVNTGALGENLVSHVFKSKGHSVLEHGSRSGRLELDLFTKDKNGVFHLVEVKSSKTKVCRCEERRFTISDSLRLLLPSKLALAWRLRSSLGVGDTVSLLDYRFNREKLFHMKQLARVKEGESSGSQFFQVDLARVELCFSHKEAIITLFENIEV